MRLAARPAWTSPREGSCVRAPEAQGGRSLCSALACRAVTVAENDVTVRVEFTPLGHNKRDPPILLEEKTARRPPRSVAFFWAPLFAFKHVAFCIFRKKSEGSCMCPTSILGLTFTRAGGFAGRDWG